MRCLDLLLAEGEGPKQDRSQKLCCFGQQGGWLSGAEDGAVSEALWLSPVPETAGLCIPHRHPCSLPSAESRKVAGCLEPKMAPPQKLSGSRLSQKRLASVFHNLTRVACPLRSPGAKEAPAGA